jgi:hypothetical protein
MDPARIETQTVTETLMRTLEDCGDDADRVTIVVLFKNGISMRLYSNARSEPEMNGMLQSGLELQQDSDD